MRYLIILVIIAFTFSCISEKQSEDKLPYYNSADFTPNWEVKDLQNFHKIRPFSVLNQNGEGISEKAMDGKITVVDFFFTTCPGICPKLTKSMYDIQEATLKDNEILLMSYSATPERDSVEVLKKYAISKKVNSAKWMLLTGKRSEIYDLGRKYYFVEEDEGLKRTDDVFLHTENFILVDKNRHIRGIYNGLDPDSMQALLRDIKTLKELG